MKSKDAKQIANAIVQTISKVMMKNKVKKVTTPNVVKQKSIEKGVEKAVELTGEYLTARDLGKKVLCSAQDINKRLEKAGLAERYGTSLILTDKGKKFGKNVTKEKANGFVFSNIEWDKIVIDLLFSEDELNRVKNIMDSSK